MASLLRSCLELCRASNLPTVWTNVLAAVVLSGRPPLSRSPLAAAAALSLIYLGGMALNDVLDAEEDRVKRPSRPIPSGRLSRRAAAWFAVVLFAAGLCILGAWGSWWAMRDGAILVAVVFLYDWLHSRSALTVLLMAGCRFLVFVTAAEAVAGQVGPAVLIAGGVQFGYIVLLTAVARWEKHTTRALPIPPIPWMLAGISLVDGALLAVMAQPAWLGAGLAGAAATRLAQARVRGD